MGNKMICCNELTPDQAQIEANLYREGKRELQRKKVLLLGAGSSGKSTLLKQMKYLYQFENDYPVDELFNFRRLVLLHILNVARTVCEQMEAWKTKCDEQSEDAMKLILSFDGSEDEEKISDNVISAVRTLWKDEEVLKVFEKRDEYTIYDNAEYFMSQLDRILAQDYRPTFADVVRTRVQTTGVIEQEFIYKGHESKPERYFIIDVGGQRSERSKWASQFSGVVAVLWVFALSSYDQKLFEQAEVNRMHEEFELFRDTSRNRAFEKINFIVLLNKHDQFQDKIERIPFECEFEEHKYKGGKHDGEKVIEWIKDTLRKLDAHESLYFHITTATDTDKFNTVFADCHEIILREQFRRAGAF